MRLPPPPLVVTLLLPLLAWACAPEEAGLDPGRFPLIPAPAKADPGQDELVLTAETGIDLGEDTPPPASGAPVLREIVEVWATDVRERTGLPLPILDTEEPRGSRTIRIHLNGLAEDDGPARAPGTDLPGTEREAYELKVSARGVTLEAEGRAGIFYGLQTLGQLLRRREPSTWVLPSVRIQDRPRFTYRGMHLDVGRHFFPVSFIKRYLDLLAAYKMNVFHWHLTEDQGWRLEIQGHPRLTEVGSCRSETMVEKSFDPYVGDGVEYCGFYTQEEAREIVAYARERFITVIPEIEMPGHSVAALAAYPELACTPGPFQVSTRWGVTRDIYCPKEETFAFLESVLGEVMEIFPSRYIHIGGDEAPKAAWEESEVAQEVMRREGLADEEELQSWFIRRIERFLSDNGRRLLGWDEILEGGLAPGATVMSWRGMEGGIQAAREGHDVVMTPTGYVYFDYYQGDTIQEPLAIGGYTPLERVYAFEPVPQELSPGEARHILGAQGNVWTEYIKTPEHVEYMVVPRMLALSEVVWSPEHRRDWGGFTRRLPAHLRRMDALDVNFRIPDVLGLEEDRLFLEDSVVIALAGPVEGGEVRYTLDGSDPDLTSPRYDGPFVLPLDEDGIEVAARTFLGNGRRGAIRRARFRKTELMRPTFAPWSARKRGLAARWQVGRFRTVEALEEEAFSAGPGSFAWLPESLPRVALPEETPSGPFGLVLTGLVRVPGKGIYTFFLSSDDGSRLRIGGRRVVDHDGPHSMSERSGQVALHRGWHPVEIRYFQSGGGAGLRLEMEGPGMPRREVPAHWLAHLRERGR